MQKYKVLFGVVLGGWDYVLNEILMACAEIRGTGKRIILRDVE